MIFNTDKTITAVRAEGTIFDATSGAALPESIEQLRALSSRAYIVVVSHMVETEAGVRILRQKLIESSVPYDEIWASYGIPDAAMWIDNGAISL